MYKQTWCSVSIPFLKFKVTSPETSMDVLLCVLAGWSQQFHQQLHPNPTHYLRTRSNIGLQIH